MFRFLALAATIILPHAAFAQTPVPAASNPPVPKKCDRSENRQFDFWVGHWKVFDAASGKPAGESVIEKLYDGCTIRENWKDPQTVGGSLNTYVANDGHWHQLWTDSSGSWRHFVGGMEGRDMVLIWFHPSQRLPGKTAQERMTFTPLGDGTVRQHMDQTSDGETWVEGYDYTYRRAPDPKAGR